MIRFHKRTGGGLYVSTRRRLRGYVIKVTEVRRVYRGGYYDMSVTWEGFDGWKAVGLNGYTNQVIYPNKKKAAEALVTNHNFWLGNPSPAFRPLVFAPSVNSPNPVVLEWGPCDRPLREKERTVKNS